MAQPRVDLGAHDVAAGAVEGLDVVAVQHHRLVNQEAAGAVEELGDVALDVDVQHRVLADGDGALAARVEGGGEREEEGRDARRRHGKGNEAERARRVEDVREDRGFAAAAGAVQEEGVAVAAVGVGGGGGGRA